MQPVRTMAVVLFAAAILVTGCTAHTSTDQPPPTPNRPGAPRLPIYRSGPAPIDRQAQIYAAVLRQYLTSGGGHDGGDAGYGGFRFPQIFVVDHTGADADALGHGVPGEPIPRAVRWAITRSLADVGPLSFTPSGEAVMVPGRCGEVRDRGILITLGPVDGVGDQVQVSVHGHVSCVAANSVTYRVHDYDESTVILRQNMSVHYEAPFLYLLLGDDQAVLVDSGATPQHEFFPLRATVDRLLADWLAEHPRDRYRLLVAHSHSHGDHTAGDVQFADRPDTTVLGADLATVTGFFGLPDWPEGTARLDLGGRVIDVIPSPGHDEPAVTYYDRSTGLLLTGDTLYPGRLYVRDWAAFDATVERLSAFAETSPVHHALGGHIEMTRRPGVDYPIRTSYQPHEPPLEMDITDLRALRRAVQQIGDTPGVHPFERFVVYHGIPARHFA